jgi:hypothetical protein
MQKSFLISLLLGTLLFFPTLSAKKKKITIHTFKTEMWQENDYLGAGYHITWDRIRPNLWVRIHRVDGEVTDTVGLPNNVMAGQYANWNLVYNRNNLYSRIPDQDLAALDPSSGNCTGSGRCFGDWINNEAVWEEGLNPGKYKDSQDQSFLILKFPRQGPNAPHGQKRTRFRFDVFVEDNTPYWLRDSSGAYSDWASPATPSEPYYPLKRVLFRLTSATSVAVDNNRRPEDIYFTERDMEKSGDEEVFKINNEQLNPIEKRVRWGKHIYSFTEFFAFPAEGQFFLEVSAEDMEGNARSLRVPIMIGKLGGLQLKDRSEESRRRE